METKIEFEWIKYEKRLLELESRIKRPFQDNQGAPGAVCAESHSTGNAETKISLLDISAVGDDQNHVYGAVTENRLSPEYAECRCGELACEIKFLKSEIEQSKHLQKQMLEMKNELDSATRQKESEIAKLFTDNQKLESENSELKDNIRRHNFEKEKEFYNHKIITRGRRRKPGLFSWLKKPLIVVNS